MQREPVECSRLYALLLALQPFNPLTGKPIMKTKHHRLRAASGVLLCGCLLSSTSYADGRLEIHEWGTFTALQDETGQALGGINIDDEPLPAFVHNLNPYVLAGPQIGRSMFMKGVPQRHPFVTLRLETPVMYFYPPAGARLPLEVDVKVALRGGWLTEFYPQAEVSAPGAKGGSFFKAPLTPQTIGTLAWKNLAVGTSAAGPKTTEHVWTAPRNVLSASVTAKDESERYLFYRGVGNFAAPLRVKYSHAEGDLQIYANFREVLEPRGSLPLAGIWLVDVRAAGELAFRQLPASKVTADPQRVVTQAPLTFDKQEFAKGNLRTLRRSMHAQLVEEGLTQAEASAMLSTWERAYFNSPGLRLFFIVPREWTDFYLPLELSKPADITRVMVGRVELVSAQQRALLKQLAGMTLGTTAWLQTAMHSPHFEDFQAGRSGFGDLGVALPADYQVYLKMGRFRNALLVDEERRTANKTLTRFINQYGLGPFRPAPPAAPKSARGAVAKVTVTH